MKKIILVILALCTFWACTVNAQNLELGGGYTAREFGFQTRLNLYHPIKWMPRHLGLMGSLMYEDRTQSYMAGLAYIPFEDCKVFAQAGFEQRNMTTEMKASDPETPLSHFRYGIGLEAEAEDIAIEAYIEKGYRWWGKAVLKQRIDNYSLGLQYKTGFGIGLVNEFYFRKNGKNSFFLTPAYAFQSPGFSENIAFEAGINIRFSLRHNREE